MKTRKKRCDGYCHRRRTETEAEQKEKDGSFRGSKAQTGVELLRRLRFGPGARSSVLAWGSGSAPSLGAPRVLAVSTATTEIIYLGSKIV